MDSKQAIYSALGKELIDYIFKEKGIDKLGDPYELGEPYIFGEPYDRHRSQYKFREPHKFPEIYELHGFRKPYTFRELYELDRLYDLHELRKRWNAGYPSAFDSRAMYGILDEVVLKVEARLAIIPMVIEMALNESPERFDRALQALSNLIPDNQILPRPPGFGEKLLKLREKVKEFSFISNITVTWSNIITKARCLKPSEPDVSYESSLSELQVSSDTFLDYFPIPISNIGEDVQCACPVSMDRIIEEENKYCPANVICNFEKFLEIRSSRWWVFRCKRNTPSFILFNYVCIRQNKNQKVEIGRCWSSTHHPMSEAALHQQLLEEEFSYYTSMRLLNSNVE